MTSTKPSPRPNKTAPNTPTSAATPPHNGFSLISNQKLLDLYTAMLRCRLIEHHSRELIKSNLPSRFFASSLGREASAVGVAIDLRRSDRIAPAHWIHSALSSIRPTVPVIEELEGALRFALLQNQKESGALVVAWPATGLLLRRFTDTDVPWWAAFPTTASVIGQWLLGRKYVENWPTWLVVNVVGVALFAYKGLWRTVLLYAVFAGMSVAGWRAWQRLAQNP